MGLRGWSHDVPQQLDEAVLNLVKSYYLCTEWRYLHTIWHKYSTRGRLQITTATRLSSYNVVESAATTTSSFSNIIIVIQSQHHRISLFQCASPSYQMKYSTQPVGRAHRSYNWKADWLRQSVIGNKPSNISNCKHHSRQEARQDHLGVNTWLVLHCSTVDEQVDSAWDKETSEMSKDIVHTCRQTHTETYRQTDRQGYQWNEQRRSLYL